jgi:hypothetical protein
MGRQQSALIDANLAGNGPFQGFRKAEKHWKNDPTLMNFLRSL